MALSMPFEGTGKFVPEWVWSCPVHDRDVADYEEGDPWLVEGEVCLDCVSGAWRAVRDAAGAVVLREVGVYEDLINRTLVAQAMEFRSGLLGTMLESNKKLLEGPVTYRWLEDGLE